MNRMRPWKWRALVLFAFSLVTLSALAVSASARVYAAKVNPGDERQQGYYTMVDRAGKTLFRTAIVLTPGDVFIDTDNKAYKVRSVEGDVARAEFMEPVDINSSLLGDSGSPVTQGVMQGPIIIYNSHSDESYVPTSGTPSKNPGDVYDVARLLASLLRRRGYDVLRSTVNFGPHDGGAYNRSRRVLMQLLRKNPAAAFDIHRDAVPPEEYEQTVNGLPVTRVTLVVGRQNQNVGANARFAQALKNSLDRKYPGFVKGILWAKGNYNQDLLPNAMLVEFGAHTNSLKRAENAAGLFADAIPEAVYGAGARRTAFGRGGFGRAALWVVAIVIASGIAFMLINQRGRLRGR